MRASLCLNCGQALAGPFCSQCGQRAIPPYPTIRELAGDAWQELSGWDGRLMRSVRVLLRRPGQLTIDFAEGRRGRYLSPVRLYLIASVVYFLVAAVTPNPNIRASTTLPGGKVDIAVTGPTAGLAGLSAEQREQALRSIERAPSWIGTPLLRFLTDPPAFIRQVQAILPRVFFVLVPVFAGLVALFYRGRFSLHLVFALHLHAAAFALLAVRRLVNLTGNRLLMDIAGLLTLLLVVAIALVSFRRVYAEGWGRLVAKSLAISALYLLAGFCGLVGAFAWAGFA